MLPAARLHAVGRDVPCVVVMTPSRWRNLVHDACRDAASDVERVNLLQAQVQLAVEGLAHAPVDGKIQPRTERNIGRTKY